MANLPTSFRLSDEAKRLIAELSRRLSLKASAVIELAVRDLAIKYGVPVQPSQPGQATNESE